MRSGSRKGQSSRCAAFSPIFSRQMLISKRTKPAACAWTIGRCERTCRPKLRACGRRSQRKIYGHSPTSRDFSGSSGIFLVSMWKAWITNGRWRQTSSCHPKDKSYPAGLLIRAFSILRSVRDNSAAPTRLADQEYKRDHRHGNKREQAEVIDVGKHGALPFHHPLEQSIRLPHGLRPACCTQSARGALEHLLHARIGRIQMRG